MKKLTRRTLTIAALVMIMVGSAWASHGVKNGTGPITDILAGEYVEITGTVAAVGIDGTPYQIDTDEGIVLVYGFGPLSYWADLEIARPIEGEGVFIPAYNVTFSNGVKTIAMSVTLTNLPENTDDDIFVPLRDPLTGVPLWR